MLNFTIIEDDKNLQKHLSNMLESIFMKYDFNAKIGLNTSNFEELLDYMKNNRVDALIFGMDSNYNLKCLEIIEKVRKINKDCYLIFETYHIEYALLAYKYKTFDFICKPISYKRLEDCIVRLFDDLSFMNKKFVKLNNKKTILSQEEIKYIEKSGTKLIFHTNSKDYEIYNSFSKIQDKLPSNFVRCHKSFIANIDNIIKIEVTDNIIYFDNSHCDIGPKYKNNFLEVINNHGSFN